MAKKDFETQKTNKEALGTLIRNLRIGKGISLRKFAKAIGLPPSNVTYIENGNNVPTAEVYIKIAGVLQPDAYSKGILDDLYSRIRNIPPPDICSILLQNKELGEKLMMLKDVQLSKEQLINIEELFSSFRV